MLLIHTLQELRVMKNQPKTKRVEAIIQKHRNNPRGDLRHFVGQSESSANLEEEGMKDKD